MLKCFVLVGFFYSYYLLCDRLISLFACDQYSHLARSVKYIKANRFFFKLILFRSAIYRHIEMFCVFVYIRSFFLMIEMYWCDLWYIWCDGGKCDMYRQIDFFFKGQCDFNQPNMNILKCVFVHISDFFFNGWNPILIRFVDMWRWNFNSSKQFQYMVRGLKNLVDFLMVE